MHYLIAELFEYPILPTTSKYVWTVKTSDQLKKPRFVILAFQTNQKDQRGENANRFDHCNISNVKLFLNSQYYPYGNLNLDVTRNQYAAIDGQYVADNKRLCNVALPKQLNDAGNLDT